MFGRPDAILASPQRLHGWLHLLTFASNGLTVFSTGSRDERGGAGSSLGLNLHDGRESGDRGTDEHDVPRSSQVAEVPPIAMT